MNPAVQQRPFVCSLAAATSLAIAASSFAADIVLNEWNCVGSQKWIGNPGSAVPGCPQPDGPAGETCSDNDDVFFGRTMGNGGDWIEFVVIKDHLDLRGWKLQWIETGGGDADGSDIWYGSGTTPQGEITFSNSSAWADLRAGTIITISEGTTAQGGLDSDTTFDPCHGDWWINANCFDAALISCNANVVDPTNPTYNDPLDVGNDNWSARILNASGGVHVNMTGEGQASWNASGVNSREVVRLEANPTPTTSPFSNYRGGDSSTCGQPNSWPDTVTQCRTYQDLEALRSPVRTQLCTACNPIALNEYNAVSGTHFLGGGTQATDASGGQASDAHFGRVMGNGGNWIELVIVAEHTDMRGWTLEWQDDSASGVIHLSTAAALSDLHPGTILTFIENTTAQGGLSTDLTYAPPADRWININTFDTALVSGTTSTNAGHISGEFSTSNDKWSLRIRDVQNNVMMEERGEGSPYYARGGISNENVCRLRQDMHGRIDAASAYDDGASLSTFGAANKWTTCPQNTQITQSLAALPIAGCEFDQSVFGDLNGDGIVDGADLGALLGQWGQRGTADLNGDGTVDGADLGALLGAWS